MTAIYLGEAIEAAADSIGAHHRTREPRPGSDWFECIGCGDEIETWPKNVLSAFIEHQAEHAVAAAAPLIEAAAREQVAQEIEAARFAEMCSCPDCDCGGTPVERATAFIDSAAIARGRS